MKKRLLVLVLLAAAVAGGVAYYRGLGFNRTARELTFSGIIETTQVEASFLLAGRVEELLVDEGYPVEKDQVIARLDRRHLLQQEREAQAALEAARARLELLRTTLELERASVKANLQAARARLEQARHDLEFWEKEWRRFDELYRQNSAAARRRDQALKAVKQARDQLNVSQANLALAEAQTIRVSRLEKEILVQQALVRRAQANLDLIRERLKDTVLRSPLKGYVLVKSVEQGEYVTPGTTVVTIAQLHKVWLRCYVSETDLGRVKLGQKVEVTVDSFPGKTYVGRISFISSEAEFTPKNIQTHKERVKLVYRMKVDLDNPHLELKPGLPADGRLLEEE